MAEPPLALPCPTVLLLHELPDGDRHVDWMLARDPQGHSPLVTFRLAGPLTEVGPGQHLMGRRLADHRPRYLSYQGPLGRGLGSVTRLAEGRIVAWTADGDAWQIEAEWAGRPGRQIVRVEPSREQGLWRIEVQPRQAVGVVEGPPKV